MRVDTPVGLQLLFGTSLLCSVEEDSTSGLVIEVFDDLDKVCSDVVLLLAVYEDMVEVLLVLELFLT